ncbi:diguanylate cyclase domain-containing protein [Hansschlegelia zhihuaiae]|uniref:Diguanylate cyclase n=1 Tax=Hansschlegelia zhihuaiae TaxID=405005 RepID=A0A4Q0MH66_9HYPH|nr:diguanylate cyclase [Hansschlegelia zhihuaiae]RXF72921.1 diguanylate cyclase [Hansschlegelia zhihuaiae]
MDLPDVAGGLSSARTLLSELESRTVLLREQNAELARRDRIVGLALATAQAGVWQCSLRDQALEWTDGVYDMFDLPRGARLRRQETLACYAEPSLRTLTRVRANAIRTGVGFRLDAEIVTPKGTRRWIRITADVERENGVSTRLYGMKQDITEAKSQAERTRRLAEVDAMTGLANRAVFEERLSDAGRRMGGECASSTLLLIDLDGFKQVNDTFGHALGDECLKTAAARLSAACAEAELVARIGGDEFAVLLGGHLGRDAIERIACAIVAALRMTVERDGKAVPVGASVGVALSTSDAPWRQFGEADAALYAAKAAGRGAFRVFGDVCAPLNARERIPILAAVG